MNSEISEERQLNSTLNNSSEVDESSESRADIYLNSSSSSSEADTDIEENINDLYSEEEDEMKLDDELLGSVTSVRWLKGHSVRCLLCYNGIQACLSTAIHSNCDVAPTAPAPLPKCQKVTSFGVCFQDFVPEILITV